MLKHLAVFVRSSILSLLSYLNSSEFDQGLGGEIPSRSNADSTKDHYMVEEKSLSIQANKAANVKFIGKYKIPNLVDMMAGDG